MRLYRTVIAHELTPNKLRIWINYCKEKKNFGCGVYIPKEVLDSLGLKEKDCLEVYVPKYGRKCIVLVPENATSKPPSDKFERIKNPRPKCLSGKPNYKIRELDDNVREIWLLEKGEVVRVPKKIARYFDLTVNDCECKYILAELYVVRDKRWIVVENFKFL